MMMQRGIFTLFDCHAAGVVRRAATRGRHKIRRQAE